MQTATSRAFAQGVPQLEALLASTSIARQEAQARVRVTAPRYQAFGRGGKIWEVVDLDTGAVMAMDYLEDSVARFLAESEQIRDCGQYQDQPAQDKQVVQVQRSPQLLSQAIQAAKTMTVSEASAYLGASRAQLLTLSRKHSFCFRIDAKQHVERELRRQARAKTKDALVERIRVYAHTGLSRDAVAKLIGISQQRLTRLVDEHDIDFPSGANPN